MKLLYIGSGFVGACSAAAMANLGHEVLLYDVDEAKIEALGSNDISKIQSCLFENALGELLLKNKERIRFTADYKPVEEFMDHLDAVFMCLPTPEKAGLQGQADLSFYFAATTRLAKSLIKRNGGKQENYIVVINKSTVPVNMIDETKKILGEHGVENFGVVSNPEFLVEGNAIEGSVRPERVVVGAETEKDFAVMRKIYENFYNSLNVKYIETSPQEAAAGKLLANYLLFSRLANSYDVVGRLCEMFDGLNYENVCKIITSDSRIGKWGFFDSLYAGGSCFIKDASSLAHQMEERGAGTGLIREVLHSNNFQRENFYSRMVTEGGITAAGKVVAILGVAFKRNTNDIRNSGAIEIVSQLIEDGVKEIRVYDPVAFTMFEQLFDAAKEPKYKVIIYFSSEKEALIGSDLVMVLTDWPQFRTLGDIIRQTCKTPYLIMDGRRMMAYQYEELQALGYDIIAVGGPFMKGGR